MRIWLAVVLLGCNSHSVGVAVDGPVKSPDVADAAAIDADLSAPTNVPIVPCTDTSAAVYAVAPVAGAVLGQILACAPSDVLALADVQTGIGSGVVATSGVSQFIVAYQTRTVGGAPAVSTARVYLPATPRAVPVPIVVTGHGSVGMADSCVPSATVDDSLPLPYAGRGFAAIAPDLAGLGNAGYQDYLDNQVQGWQMLDGARALRAMLPAGLTAPDLILSGYSQGGGAALSAQALLNGDGPGIGTPVATVVYAPEWPIRWGSFDYIGILDDPTQLTIETGLSYSSVAVLRQYAFFENHIGAGTGHDSVATQFQAGLDSAVSSQCLVGFGAYVQINMLHTGDLTEDSLRTGVLACIAAEGPDAGCTGNALAYYNFLNANVLPPDPNAGPVLMVQGLDDLIMPAANEAACVHDDLQGAGVDVDTCVFASSDHTDIMDQHGSGVAWAESVLAGGARAECNTGSSLPACN